MQEQHVQELAVGNVAQKQPTLLLVDDEENILAALRRLLRREGYHILCATSGAEGLKLLEGNSVDVIVSDQRMPAMTGVEFLRKVRQHNPETIRIVLSGYTELQSIIDAVNEGAVYKFLTKPWDDEQLCEHVREAFRQKQLTDENVLLNNKLAEANAALAQSNAELQSLLGDKTQRLACDETMIEISREILESLPFALIVLDNENMIVFTNRRAEYIFNYPPCAIGSFADQCLPLELLEFLASPASEEIIWHDKHESFKVSCHDMGVSSSSQGRVLTLIGTKNTDQ